MRYVDANSVTLVTDLTDVPADCLPALAHSEVLGYERVVLVADGEAARALGRTADMTTDCCPAHAMDLMDSVAAHALGPPARGALAAFAPATRIVDELIRHDSASCPDELAGAAEDTPTFRRLASVLDQTDPLRLRDLARVVLLLRPPEIESSDEWARLASNLAGRAYSVADIALLQRRHPELFTRTGRDGRQVVSLRTPLAATLACGGIATSGSEHYALFRALRARAAATLVSNDASDAFIRRQLPRQAIESFAFVELFQDALAVLCSDPLSLVAEVERTTQMTLFPGAKCVLLAAHRLGPDEHARASHLELAALRVGLDDFARAITAALPRRAWRPVWTRARPVNANRVVLSTSLPILALASGDGCLSGSTLVGLSDGTAWQVRLYESARRIWDNRAGYGEVRAIASHANTGGRGVALLGTSDERVVAVDVESSEIVWEVAHAHAGPLSALARIVEDGQPVVSGGVDGVVRASVAESGAELWTHDHGKEIRALSVVTTPHGAVVAFVSVDGVTGLLDAASGAVLASVQLGIDDVLNGVGAAVHRDRLAVVVGTTQGEVKLLRWELPAEGAPCAQELLTRHDGPINAISVRVDGDVLECLSGSADHTWRFTTVGEDVRPSQAIEGHFGAVLAIDTVILDDRSFVITGGGDGTVRLWVRNAVCQESLELEKATRHHGPVRTIALARGEADELTVVTGGTDGDVRLWASTGTSTRPPLIRQHGEVSKVAIVAPADGRRDPIVVLSGSLDGTIEMVTIPPDDEMSSRVLGVAHEGVTALAWTTRDSSLVVASGGIDGSVSLWSHDVRYPLATADAQRFGAVHSLEFVAAGDGGGGLLAVVGQDGSVVFRRTSDLQVESEHALGGGAVLALCRLPDHASGLVAGTADGAIWTTPDVHKGRHQWTQLGQHGNEVTGIAAFVVSGRAVVASAGLDRRIRIWDLSTQLKLQEIALDGIAFDLAALSPYVGVATSAGAAVFELSSDPLLLAAPDS